MAIKGVKIGAEAKFKSLLADSCKQHSRLMALVDIKVLKKVGEELEKGYHAQKKAIIALERLLEGIDARLQLTLRDRQGQFNGRLNELVKQVNNLQPWPSVRIENLLKSINGEDFLIIRSSTSKEMGKFAKLCGDIFETLNAKYFLKAALTSNAFEQESVKRNVYDSEADHKSNVYLGVYAAIASVNSIKISAIKQYIVCKTAAAIKESVTDLWASTELVEEAILDYLARDNENLFAGAADLSKTTTRSYLAGLNIAEELVAEMERIVKFVEKPPNKIAKAPIRESPGEHELLPSSQNSNGLTVGATKFADDTFVCHTAWGVSEDLLRCLVGIEWSLGADIATILDKKLRPDLVGRSCTELDVENVVNLLRYSESILDEVLQRNNDGTYVLDDTDPLSVDRICELLGLLKAMCQQIPKQCFSKNFMTRGTTVRVDRGVMQKIGKSGLINLRALVAITKNVITGYCNTYYSVCGLADDLGTVKKTIQGSSQFVKIEQLNKKIVNRFRGYINTLIIYHNSSWLPLRSQDQRVKDQNIAERSRIRGEVKEKVVKKVVNQ